MATPKKPTPKVKITGSASGRAATGTKSVIRGGSMAQSPKIVDRKPVAKKAKTTVYKPKQASPGQQVAKAAGKVIGRAKSVAREVRDIPTAIGTFATVKNRKDVKTAAKENIKMQIKDVVKAAKGGKGYRSAQTVNKGSAIRTRYNTKNK